jgi:ankyrin repeat protein
LEAARAGDVEKTQALLEEGADPNGKDAEGETALVYATDAATPRHTRIVELLLAHGAKVDNRAGKAWNTRTPLQIATWIRMRLSCNGVPNLN